MADAPIDPSKVTVGQAKEAVASGAAENLDEAAGVVSENAGAVTGAVEEIKGGVSGFADDLLGDFMPKEPVCPTIPGITFPTLPDLDKLGEIKDDALEDVNKLSERVKNPPSAKDLMEEIGNKVSDEAEKAKKALEKAALDMKKDIEKQLADQWQKAQDAMTEIEKGVEALADGSAIKEIGADLADIPLAAVGGAFAGFKNALECLEGAAGSAKAEFTKVADALGEDLENGGRGLSATAADEAITSQAEETTDENGNKIKKQKTISREDAAKSVEGTTKNAVPQSDNPIATEKDAVSESDKVSAIGEPVADKGASWQTWGPAARTITSAEYDRAFSGLPPAFTRPPALRKHQGIPAIEEGDTLSVIQAKYDAWYSKETGADDEKKGTKKQRSAERRRKDLVKSCENLGRPVPEKWLKPIKMTKFDVPGNSWRQTDAPYKWHSASYNMEEGPPAEIDGSQTNDKMYSTAGALYVWKDGELSKA